MSDNIEAFNQMGWLRAGGYTRRYHGWRTLKDDPVGQHSYNVANIILVLRPDCRKELVVAGVRHDSAEWRTGDVPADVKRTVPGLKEAMDAAELKEFRMVGLDDPTLKLRPDEYWVLKLADYFDGMMYCLQERQMGNTLMDGVFGRYSSYMGKFLEDAPHDVEHDIYNHIALAWAAAGGPIYDGE